MSDLSRWMADNGDSTHRLNYPLDENSIVLDVGGYEGRFAELIYDKYKCNIFIYEPINSFFNAIQSKFQNVDKIKCYNVGLSDKVCSIVMNLNGDSSSTEYKDKNLVLVNMVDFNSIMEKHQFTKIDLIKINIEGGEYDLLNSIIDNNYHQIIENIQVQFHNFVPNYRERYNEIYNKLALTHELTYKYDFIWENWRKKN